MIYEFEGRTEKEAVDRAAAELGVEKNAFDVEIIEAQRGGLFKKSFVKIKVHTDEPDTKQASEKEPAQEELAKKQTFTPPDPQNDFEKELMRFVENIIARMGFDGKVSAAFRENRKIGLRIDSKDSSILIGKKGKTLDAMQLLANLYAGKLGREDMRVILDSENYRIRREEALVRLAYTVADRVRETRNSILLEPMNPFDRRLIHTTINTINDIDTKSEGEGVYKQVRVFFKGNR